MLKTLKIKLKISHRLALGFAIVVLMLAAAVGTTLWRIGAINEGTGRIVGLRMPTAQTSAQLTNDINASLAALRGWMLTGNPTSPANLNRRMNEGWSARGRSPVVRFVSLEQ